MFEESTTEGDPPTRVPLWDDTRRPSVEELACLVRHNPFDLDELAQVEHLRGIEAHIRWLESLKVEAMVAVAGQEPTHDDEGREEVAAALSISPGTAANRLDTARALRCRLRETAQLLRAGRVSLQHATVLHEVTATLSDSAAELVEQQVLATAVGATPGQLRSAARRAVARVAPVSMAAAYQEAANARRVLFWPGELGMTVLSADLPDADAAAIRLALDGLAAADERDLPIDAKRADALTRLATGALTGADLPRRHGRPAQVQVVVDLPTLLGLANNPGEIPGFGPVPAPVARRLATDATWRRLVTEPVTGHLLDFGRTVYTPPQELLDFIIARDRTCTFPGCPFPAYACDADHTVPYDDGGSTSAAGLRMLCRRHHRLKTHHRWRPLLDPDGAITWTSPAGATYRTKPPPVLT